MAAPETIRLGGVCTESAPHHEPSLILGSAGFERATQVLPDRLEAAGHGCDLLAWAASGGMWLTGHADGPPLSSPTPLLARFGKVTEAVRLLTGELGRPVATDPATLLFGRAALRGHSRQGRTAPGGACRLLPARDGWVAVNLARPDDVASVPAVVGDDREPDPWRALAAAASRDGAAHLVERCRLLGLPAAVLPGRDDAPQVLPEPFSGVRLADPRPRRRPRPLVADLSAMWAGPLCTHLLGASGAEVVKVESVRRPDSVRTGCPPFFDWLHAGHASVALDLTDPSDIERLRRLVHAADVVVEASRPRALRELLDSDAADAVAASPGKTWVSITGYGRREPGASWVAFGDDAAVAGGLVATDPRGEPVFCGDALADPLAGTYAALAALASLLDGGGMLIDVAMQGVAAHLAWAGASGGEGAGTHAAERTGEGWTVRHGERAQQVLPPGPPPPAGQALPLGASNARVLGNAQNAPAP